MKIIKHLVIIGLLCGALLLPSSASSWGVVGLSAGAGGGGSCSTGTVNQEYASSGDGGFAITASAKGQSFQVSKAGSLYSISIYCDSVTGGGGDVTMRWGTSNNLTTYTAEKVVSITSVGWHEFVFETHDNVATGTTYYFGCSYSGVNEIAWQRDTSDGYASGSYYYGSSGWNMSDPMTRDTYFRVSLCD